MKWINACINNKLVIYLSAILLCLVGLFCISVMKIAPFPSIQFNTITITLNYPGANAETVEREATSKIVVGLRSISNIQNIIANSQAGSAEIDLTLNAKNSEALLETQMQIMQAIASSNLPSAIQQPQVKINKGVSGLITMALTSDQSDVFKLKTLAQGILIPHLSSLSGVIVDAGNFDPVIKIMLNPQAIAAYHLDPVKVTQLLDTTYQSSPLGALSIQDQSYILNTSDNIQSIDDLGNIMVAYQRTNGSDDTSSSLGNPIYLKNIAKISFEPRSIIPDDILKTDGKAAVMINLQTESTANPFSVSEKTNAYLKQFASQLPQGINIIKIFDMSKLMQASITEVLVAIAISSILVLLIALIFLGRLKTTIIPIMTIPICLLSAITFVYWLGFTINILTLLALVIAVGLVVDDAVVVVENITRYLEQGMKKQQAVLQGTSDIALTIIGITLTLVVVYLPIAFSTSDVASLFKPFALTLAAAIFVSGVIALTLTPVMAITFLTDQSPNDYQKKFDKLLKYVVARYREFLATVIRSKYLALFVIALLIAIGSYISIQLPKKVFPDDPNRRIFIHIAGSPEDTANSLEKKASLFSSFYHSNLLSDHILDIHKDPFSGKMGADLILVMKAEYIKSSYPFADKINQFIQTQHLNNIFVKVDNVSNWGNNFDVSFYVYGGNDINGVNHAVDGITSTMENSGNFSFVSNNINQPQKQLTFKIDTPKAASLGIFKSSIIQLLSAYYGGNTLNNYFNIANLSVPIVVQVNNDDLKNPDSLDQFNIQSPVTKKYYSLADFVSLTVNAKPLSLTTFNGQPAVQITANLKGNYSLGNAISYINQLMQTHYSLLQYQYTDNAKNYLDGNNETLFIAIMGIVLVYFLLAMLFKNLIDPFIIMLTVPFSIIGGIIFLYFTGNSINLYSALGLITLVGLITKHGILIVQLANREIQKGISATEAILTAAILRFRPIIMTTLIMIFGALPLVFSSNIFYVARQNLGISIIGGLLVGTLFSLFVVPLVYVLTKNR